METNFISKDINEDYNIKLTREKEEIRIIRKRISIR